MQGYIHERRWSPAAVDAPRGGEGPAVRIHVNDKRLVTRRGWQGAVVVARCTWKTFRRFDSKSWLVKYENRKTTRDRGRDSSFSILGRLTRLKRGRWDKGRRGRESFFLVFLGWSSNGFWEFYVWIVGRGGVFCLRVALRISIFTRRELCASVMQYYATPFSEYLKFVKGEKLQSCNEVLFIS